MSRSADRCIDCGHRRPLIGHSGQCRQCRYGPMEDAEAQRAADEQWAGETTGQPSHVGNLVSQWRRLRRGYL